MSSFDATTDAVIPVIPDTTTTAGTTAGTIAGTTTTTTAEPPKRQIRTWDDLELKTDLLRGIYAAGFDTPSEIQQAAILPIISNHDVIAQAQSGTGKTGSFTIGALQLVDIANRSTQVLILSPTHELATQTASTVRLIGGLMDGLIVKTLLGGTPVADDAQDLRNNPPHVIIGCTGRVFDMIRRGNLQINNLRILVLDEADEMLSEGFKEQIYNIFKHVPNSMQVALFSATMPEDIMAVTTKFMREPVKIMMKPEELNLEGIKQFYIAVANDHEKYDRLKELFEQITLSQCIIYANSVKRVTELHTAMQNEGFPVCAIHSTMTKSERQQVIQQFRQGVFRVMISSNITARGIDVQQVSVVINFDITNCVHTYLHRIGRSGRWGRKGVAINFVTRHDTHYMRNIEAHYGVTITELTPGFNFNRI